jgi:hypothetical protein
MAEDLWMVVRTGDDGNSMLVRDGLTELQATELTEELTRRGHKQFYNMYPYTAETRREILENYQVIG